MARADGQVAIAEMKQDGITIAAGFIAAGKRSSALFASLAAPRDGARGGVVICPSLHAEFTRNYRTEILLGRTLAGLGFSSIRPHYAGQGHSYGDVSAMTYGSMQDDTRDAAEFLRRWSAVEEVAFVGCRMGAFPAGAIASEASAPAALWEPVLEWSSFIREAKRVVATRDLTAGGGSATSPSPVHAQGTDGPIDLLGYPVYAALTESFAGHRLIEEVGGGSAPMLLLQVGREAALRGGYRSLAGELSGRGHPVATSLVSGDAGWWFRGTRQDYDESERMRTQSIAAISAWLSSVSAEVA